MMAHKKNVHVHRKIHGHHQKRTRHFLKVYTPYLPLAFFVTMSFVLSAIPAATKAKPKSASQGVLAYATEMSASNLLSSTNQQRANNGLGGLNLNAKLNSAAQAKANDMVSRNYWSHNTPDGNPPWVFITNAGYSYSRAGENLAYGYNTSADTVNGWMNSPSHRDNILSRYYSDVGFGITNSASYSGDPSACSPNPCQPGPQTIVVAMYATPYTAPKPVASTAPQKTTPAPAPAPVQETPKVEKKKAEIPATTSANTDSPNSNNSESVKSQSVNRFEAFTKSSLPWLGSLLLILSTVGGLIVLTKHGLAFQHLIISGERYVLQHTLFDVTIISLMVFSFIATRTVGVIL